MAEPGDVMNRDFEDGEDGLSPVLDLRLEGARAGRRNETEPGLLFVAAKVLHRVGGDLKRPHDTLLHRDSNELTALGKGLILYAALTIAVFPDQRFFQSGRLLELGQELADKVGLPTWDAFIRQNYPSLGPEAGIQVELSYLLPGSFWFKIKLVPTLSGIAAVVAIMNQGPGAVQHAKDIYLPAAVDAMQAGHDYAKQYAEALGKLLVIETYQRERKLPDDIQLLADRPPKPRLTDEENE